MRLCPKRGEPGECIRELADFKCLWCRRPLPHTHPAASVASHQTPRLCQDYCNARLILGFTGPRCPHCDACQAVLDIWERAHRSTTPPF